MSFVEKTLACTAKIEQLLEHMGGRGMGLRELSDSIRPKLGGNLHQRIRDIGMVRNKLAHEYGYRYPGNEYEFLQDCQDVVRNLGRNAGGDTAGSFIGKSPNLDNNHGRATMTIKKAVTWVTQVPDFMAGSDYPSTLTDRLVFISGPAVYLKEPGRHHSAGYGFPLQWMNSYRIDSIAYVRMSSADIDIIDEGNVHTRDQIPLRLDYTLTLKVVDAPEAIGSVVRDEDHEVSRLVSVARQAFHELASQHDYDDLVKSRATMGADAVALLARHGKELAFEIKGISLVNLGSPITPVDRQYVDGAVAVLDARNEEARRQLEKLQMEHEYVKQRGDMLLKKESSLQELDRLKATAAVVAMPGGLEVVNPALALKKLELEAKIKESEIALAMLERSYLAATDRNGVRVEEQDRAYSRRHGIDLNINRKGDA